MEQMIDRFRMQPHPEGGFFAECHYEHAGEGRAASGSIYYFLRPTDRSDFHQIDCDEYWCHTAGGALELWVIAQDGTLRIELLGPGEGQEPLLFIPAGAVFAARHPENATDGTFVCCITVPRFSYESFRIVQQAEIETLCPEALAFFLDEQGTEVRSSTMK